MISDTRSRNRYFETNSPFNYLLEYVNQLSEAIKKIDRHELERAIDLVQTKRQQGGLVFVAGNGGSAAIAEHLCCDWTKGTYLQNSPPIRAFPLVSNLSLITAIANDLSYNEIFSSQLEMTAARGDLLIVISSSGESLNVVQAAKKAKEMDIPVLALTGFHGGTLAKICDVSLHVPFENYGVVEDSHQILMHVIAQWVYLQSVRSS